MSHQTYSIRHVAGDPGEAVMTSTLTIAGGLPSDSGKDHGSNIALNNAPNPTKAWVSRRIDGSVSEIGLPQF